MTDDRAAGQALLDELTAGLDGITRSPMFGSSGVRRNGTLLAFVGRDGALILRLPWAHAEVVKAQELAHDVRMGGGVAREWVGVPLPADDGAATWKELLDAAYVYAG